MNKLYGFCVISLVSLIGWTSVLVGSAWADSMKWRKDTVGDEQGVRFSWVDDDGNVTLDAMAFDPQGAVVVGNTDKEGSDNANALLGADDKFSFSSTDFGIGNYALAAAISGKDVGEDRTKQQAAIVGYNDYSFAYPGEWNSGILGIGRNGVVGYAMGTNYYPGVAVLQWGFGVAGLGSTSAEGGVYGAANRGTYAAKFAGKVYIGPDTDGLKQIDDNGDGKPDIAGDLIIDGGSVYIGTYPILPTATPTQKPAQTKLNIVGLPEYVDNAAALAAGLTAGAVYRNGDLLQVVH